MESSPRVAAFVRSQTANLPFYRTQGEALLASYLSAQRPPPPPPAEDADRFIDSTSSQPAPSPFELRSSPPITPHDFHRGANGVDVLNAARERPAPAGTVAGRPSARPARHEPLVLPVRASSASKGRLVDRMKGRDGGSASGAQPAPAAKKQKRSDRGSGGSSVVLTKRAVREQHQTRPSSVGQMAGQLPSAPSPRKRKRTDSDAERPAPQQLSASAVDVEDMIEMERAPPTPPTTVRKPQARPLKRSAMAKATPAAPPTPLSPCNLDLAQDQSRKPIWTVSKRPTSGLDGFDEDWKAAGSGGGDDDDRRVVRLGERRTRRRVKAAIVKPKPAPSVDDGYASAQSDDSPPAGPRRVGTKASSRKPSAATKRTESSRTKGKTNCVNTNEALSQRGTRATKRLGLGALDSFKATNVVEGRLTLRRADGSRPGVFNKGVASSKVAPAAERLRGVPDLVFSESAFLGRVRPSPRDYRLNDLSPMSGDLNSSSSSPTSSSRLKTAARKAAHSRLTLGQRHASSPPSQRPRNDDRTLLTTKNPKQTIATLTVGSGPDSLRFMKTTRAARKSPQSASPLSAASDAISAAREMTPSTGDHRAAGELSAEVRYSPSWPDSAAGSQQSLADPAGHASEQENAQQSDQASVALTGAADLHRAEPIAPQTSQSVSSCLAVLPAESVAHGDIGSLLYLPPTLPLPAALPSSPDFAAEPALPLFAGGLDPFLGQPSLAEDTQACGSVVFEGDPLLLGPLDDPVDLQLDEDGVFSLSAMDAMRPYAHQQEHTLPNADIDFDSEEEEHGVFVPASDDGAVKCTLPELGAGPDVDSTDEPWSTGLRRSTSRESPQNDLGPAEQLAHAAHPEPSESECWLGSIEDQVGLDEDAFDAFDAPFVSSTSSLNLRTPARTATADNLLAFSTDGSSSSQSDDITELDVLGRNDDGDDDGFAAALATHWLPHRT